MSLLEQKTDRLKKLDIKKEVKAAMRQALKECDLSRDEVADRMTGIMGMLGIKTPGNSKRITKHILEKWVAEEAPHIIPFTLLPVFCYVVGSYLPLQVAAKSLGLEIINSEDQKILAWAKAEIAKRQMIKKAKRLAKEIGIE